MLSPAATVIAAAGREAAGMSRRFIGRYVDVRAIRPLSAAPGGGPRLLSGSTGEFAARIADDRRIALRIGGLRAQVGALRDAAARTAPGGPSAGTTRRAAPVMPARAGRPSLPVSRSVPRPAIGGQRRPFRPGQPPAHAPAPGRPTAVRPLSPIFRKNAAFPRAESAPPFLPPPGVARSGGSAGLRGGVTRPPAVPPSPSLAPAVWTGGRPPAPPRETKHEDTATADAPDYRRLAPTALRDTLRHKGGDGAALDFALRERLRGPLRFDPAQARLHRGQAAAEAARALSAQAFTIGRDVFFGQGRYEPTTGTGLELLAHELTHVGQQTRLAGAQMRFFTASGGDAMEEEAQQTASRVRDMTGWGAPSGAFTQPAMQLAMPPSDAGTVPTTASFTAGDASGQESRSGHGAPSARTVADHVYGLMKSEIAHGSRRGQAYGKG